MKPDDFEQKLQRQPMRQIPAGWRAEILSAAKTSARKTAPVQAPEMFTLWRSWLARIPAAWSAVAAVWIVIIGVNMLLSGPAVTHIARSAPPAADTMTVWNLQRPDSKLMANLLSDSPASTPATEPSTVPPRPRSDLRREEHVGELFSEDSSRFTA